MKPTHYIITLIITISIMCLLVLHSQQNVPEGKSIPPKLELVCTTSQAYTIQKIVIPEIPEPISTKPDRGGERGRMMEITAYNADCCDKEPSDQGYGITASGNPVKPWYTVAAGCDQAFGTKIYIPFFKDKPNGGIFVVQDRGGMIGNGRIDVYVEDYASCMEFGRQRLEVYVLG